MYEESLENRILDLNYRIWYAKRHHHLAESDHEIRRMRAFAHSLRLNLIREVAETRTHRALTEFLQPVGSM